LREDVNWLTLISSNVSPRFNAASKDMAAPCSIGFARVAAVGTRADKHSPKGRRASAAAIVCFPTCNINSIKLTNEGPDRFTDASLHDDPDVLSCVVQDR
jgi:hypothetical protein